MDVELGPPRLDVFRAEFQAHLDSGCPMHGSSTLEGVLAPAASDELRLSAGGRQACATCHVLIRQGADSLAAPDDEEEDQLDKAWGVEPCSRLACAARIGQGDITIELPRHSRNHARERVA